MIGWHVQVYRQKPERILLAEWTTAAFGIRWIDDLVKEGKAIDHGGDGYPCTYSGRAGVLLPVILRGLPAHATPAVIGEDYVQPAGWTGKVEVHRDRIAECPDDEELLVQAWDQS
jgi:hypothetical protein